MPNENSQPNSDKKTPTTSYVQKLSLMAGSVSALYMLPTAANAAIVHTTTPLSVSFDDSVPTFVDWDVDGDSNSDFVLVRSTNSSSGTTTLNFIGIADRRIVDSIIISTENNVPIASNQAVLPPLANDSSRPNYFVIQGSSSDWGLANLSPGFAIPNSLGSGGYYPYPGAILMGSYSGSGTYINGNFEDGVDGYFGFFFNIDDAIHAGWAKINLDLGEFFPSRDEGIALDNATIPTATISEWAYESTPETCIAVGDTSGTSDCKSGESTPEPTSTLALLSMGAAGVYKWRKRKQLITQAERDAA